MPESVCCGIAVPAVAEQSNTRAAESVSVATGEACDCFRGLTLTLLSALPLLLPLVLSLYLAQLYAGPYGESPVHTVSGGSFQVCGIQASYFQVMLADVFVPEH